MFHVFWHFVNNLCHSLFKFCLLCVPVEFIFPSCIQEPLSITLCLHYQIPWLVYQYVKKLELDMVVCCNYYYSGFGWQKQDWFSNILSICNFSDPCIITLSLSNWRYSKIKATRNSDPRNLLWKGLHSKLCNVWQYSPGMRDLILEFISTRISTYVLIM